MTNITREMLEEAVENEKRDKAKFEKDSNNFTKAFVISFFAVFFVFTVVHAVLKTGAFAVVLSLLVFIIIFAAIAVVGIAVLAGSYSRIFSVKKALMAYQNSRFYNQLKFADDKGKILLLNKRIENAKGEKLILAADGLMPIYAKLNMKSEMEELMEKVTAFVPKNDYRRATKLEIELMYFEVMEDLAGFVHTFDENEDFILRYFWGNPRLAYKLNFLSNYSIYLFCKKEYENALKIYLNFIELSEMARGIDSTLDSIADELSSKKYVDLSKLYFYAGDKEKAAESFEEALRRFENNSDMSIRIELNKLKKLFDEAGVKYNIPTVSTDKPENDFIPSYKKD